MLSHLVCTPGFRIGKGEGFADLEYAMMATMEAVGPDTIVVTTVHDDQVVDIPEELVEDHDLTVDYIVTPTQVEHHAIQKHELRTKEKNLLFMSVKDLTTVSQILKDESSYSHEKAVLLVLSQIEKDAPEANF